MHAQTHNSKPKYIRILYSTQNGANSGSKHRKSEQKKNTANLIKKTRKRKREKNTHINLILSGSPCEIFLLM